MKHRRKSDASRGTMNFCARSDQLSGRLPKFVPPAPPVAAAAAAHTHAGSFEKYHFKLTSLHQPNAHA